MKCRRHYFYYQLHYQGEIAGCPETLLILCNLPSDLADRNQWDDYHQQPGKPAGVGCHHLRLLSTDGGDHTDDIHHLYEESGEDSQVLLADLCAAGHHFADCVYEPASPSVL